jgi:hypothetical protein
VEARFVSQLEDGTVRLQRPDGRFVRIRFDRLSSADQRFVLEYGNTLALK